MMTTKELSLRVLDKADKLLYDFLLEKHGGAPVDVDEHQQLMADVIEEMNKLY
jgi:hypothetical protein|tara:strand:+ start:241 stop:399 length:159 start_codon:yes stop_codon:yes gene_type:complete